MDAEQLWELKRSDPFKPFRLRTRNGTEHQVNAADAFLVPTNKIAFIDGTGISQVALTHIESIEPLASN